MVIQSVALVGLGALGILFGTPISKLPGIEFVVIADKDRIEKYQKEGVRFNDENVNFKFAVPEEMAPVDLVLFGVKYNALQSAMIAASKAIGENTVLVSLLNGITSEEVLDDRWRGHVLWEVSTDMDATRIGRTLICHAKGKIQIGEKNGQITPRLEAVGNLFKKAGIETEVRNDILERQWFKLMVNVGVNQASAAFDVPYGGLVEEGEARKAMVDAMEEVIHLSALEGCPLPDDAAVKWIPMLSTFNPNGMPSLRQDVLAKRPTEVELFSGTILRLAATHDLQCPVNEMLYNRIRAIENAY